MSLYELESSSFRLLMVRLSGCRRRSKKPKLRISEAIVQASARGNILSPHIASLWQLLPATPGSKLRVENHLTACISFTFWFSYSSVSPFSFHTNL